MLFPAPAIFDLRWCRSYSHRCKQKWPKGHCWRKEATKHDCVVLQPLETYIAKESTKGNPFRGWQYLDHRHPSNPKGPSDRSDPKYEISCSFLWSYEHVSYRQVREWGCFCIFLAGFTSDMHHRERCGIFPLKPLEVWSIHTCTRKIQQNPGTAIFYQKE